jgi:hypothetical protein
VSTTLIYPFKQGDTFSLGMSVILPAPAGEWHVASQVRQADGTLVEDLEGTVVQATTPGVTATTGVIKADSDATESWPEEKLKCDVRFYDDSTPPVKVTFPTFIINMIDGETDA